MRNPESRKARFDKLNISEVSTWADGFGRWHAVVRFKQPLPDSAARSPKVRAIARKAIRDELVARSYIGQGYQCLISEVTAYSDHKPAPTFAGTMSQVEYVERYHAPGAAVFGPRE